MADGSPGKYVVPVILEMFAFSFALSAVDSFRAGKPWPDYSSASACAVLISVAGFRWPWIKNKATWFVPWQQLKLARLRIDELSQLTSIPSKLKIHAASWGNATSRKPVLDAVNRQPKDALVLVASNDGLGVDPAIGDDNKYLEVEYSYGDGPMLRSVRYQGQIMILPEDKPFIERAAEECERRRVADLAAQAEDLMAEIGDKIDKIPQQVVNENSNLWQWIGKITQLATDAILLKERLARLEYEWSASNQRLDLPLADSTMPGTDAPLSWNQRQLLGYRFIYREHLERVRILAPGFTSIVMREGFPSALDSYRIKQVLQFHADDLGTHIVETLKSPNGVP